MFKFYMFKIGTIRAVNYFLMVEVWWDFSDRIRPIANFLLILVVK